jgi:uncharacterized protein YciI
MAIYAVQYVYSDDLDAVSEVRPSHREFCKDLVSQGTLLASGPLVDRNSALLLVRTDDITSVARILNTDPFEVAGLITERVIEEWKPVTGPWAE